jgi:hypothetical protein
VCGLCSAPLASSATEQQESAMLDTAKFIYEHGVEFVGGIIAIVWWSVGAYVVATWLRTTSHPDAIEIPDTITIRLEHHHFALTDENLPEEDA